MNAFCNTDDITWGTKNLDTKKDATEAKHLMKSGLAYTSNQVSPGAGAGRWGLAAALGLRSGSRCGGMPDCARWACCAPAHRACRRTRPAD